MADKKYGILLTAKDNASKSIKGLAKSAGVASAAVKKMGSSGATAMKAIGFAAVAVNQAAELVKKFKDSMVMASEMSMQYRRENDPLIEQFKKSKNLIGSLAARVGDVLVNAFGAATNALGPVIKNARLWLVENQKLMASGIINFLKSFAQILVTGIAKAVLFLSRATNGWMLIWQLLVAAVNSAMAAIINGGAKALRALSTLASIVGSDGLAGKLDAASESVKGMGEIFADTSEDAKAKIGVLIDQQVDLEDKINRISTAFKKGIGDVASTAIDGLAKGTEGLNVTLDETLAKEEKLAETAKDAASSSHEAWASAAGTIGQSLISAFASGEEASDAMGEQIMAWTMDAMNAMIQAAITQIGANAAVASSGAAASQAGIPVIGPYLASAAAVAMSAMVLAFKNDVPQAGRFNRGGIVPGVGDSDSVPGLLTPGELILPKDMTKRLLSIARQPSQGAQFSNGGLVRGGGAGGVTINFNENSMVQRTPAEQDKWIKEKLLPSLNRLRRKGITI